MYCTEGNITRYANSAATRGTSYFMIPDICSLNIIAMTNTAKAKELDKPCNADTYSSNFSL